MNHGEFSMQMSRLVANFGDRNYSDERIKLFWREAEPLDITMWKRIVEKFIAECRYAPLLPELREAISVEREYQHEVNKRKYRQEAEEFMWGKLADDEISFAVSGIVKRMKNEMSEEDWTAHQRILASLGKP